jgi:prepilin-type N-terminal cleavage/methylation domain-containing protein
MRKETKKYVNRCKAFTLIELILVTAAIAIVAGALVGMIYSNYDSWKLGSSRSTLLQDGRAVLEMMTRVLRQTQRFTSVTSPGDSAGQITFADVDGTTQQFRLNTSTGEIEYGQPGSLSALAGNVNNLVFTCYDIEANSLPSPVNVRKIRAVHIAQTLTDPATSQSFTLSDRVFVQDDFISDIVLNEIMYNPINKAADGTLEWVEIYNTGAAAIDLAGWTIWTGTQNSADTLISHPQFGNGSTIIPANGYAVVTAAATDVYTELVTNGGFEASNISLWIRTPGSSWTRTSGGAHGGTRKLESTTAGATSVYQQITIPSSGFNNCLFLFWEKTTAPPAQTQITATIRDTSNVVLATGYSGQMSSNWTYHTINITAFAGQTIRIYFDANNAAGSGALMLDDVSAAYSYVNINAVRLGVGDNKIGSGLANNGDTAAIVNGSSTVDSISYLSSWGGNGDGTSLSRIDPNGPSSDASNWTSGPQHGTPGSVN